jgi:restriction system protein
MVRRFYKVMPGSNASALELFLQEEFVGVDFGVHRDLTGKFPEEFREFSRKLIPLIQELRPEKTKISAGLAAGCIWRIGRGMSQGDIVLCPDNDGELHIGEVTGNYFYVGSQKFPHRRKVTWTGNRIKRADCSRELQNALRAGQSVICLDEYTMELEQLLGDGGKVQLRTNDSTIDDPAVFALEKYLEEFLVANWEKTELAKRYSIYSEDGVIVGQQFATDTGPIDILAVSKDDRTLLVIELKRGRTSDVVVGQIQRYMGFVSEELAEDHQEVRGLIIALEDDARIRRALVVAKGIDFYRYEINFRLLPMKVPD